MEIAAAEDPGGAWEEDTERALCRSWAPALNGGASGDTCGWPSSSRMRGLAARLGSCFWQPPTYCPGPVPSGKTVLQTPGRVFLGALARRLSSDSLRVSAQGCCHSAAGPPSLQAEAQIPHQGFCCDGLKHGTKNSSREPLCRGVPGHQPAAPESSGEDGGRVVPLGPRERISGAL